MTVFAASSIASGTIEGRSVAARTEPDFQLVC
jgi:hypothetical protein